MSREDERSCADQSSTHQRRKLPPSFGILKSASASVFNSSETPKRHSTGATHSHDHSTAVGTEEKERSIRNNELSHSSASSSFSSSQKSAAAAASRHRFEWHMQRMTHVFDCFSSFGGQLNSSNEMDGTHFVRMLREAGLVDRSTFTAVDADLLFRKIKDKKERVLTPQLFLALGVPEIAARRKLSTDRVAAILYEASEAFVEVPMTTAEQRLFSQSSMIHQYYNNQNYENGNSGGGEGNSSSLSTPMASSRLKAARPPRSSSASPSPYTSAACSPARAHSGARTRFKHIRSSSLRGGGASSFDHRNNVVRLHDDKSLYTGVHKRGGISCADRDPSDLASVVDRRKGANIRGAVA